MFYATELFIKKGALAKIWLAGTVFQKLNKKSILDSDIEEFCNQVRQPPVALAISTCGRLTLGIVRIHDKMIQYLLIDAEEAKSSLRRVLAVDGTNLPQDRLRARPDQINIVQQSEEEILELEDLRLDNIILLPQDESKAEELLAKPEDITLADDFPALLEEKEEMRRANLDLDLTLEFGPEPFEIDFEQLRMPSREKIEALEIPQPPLPSGATPVISPRILSPASRPKTPSIPEFQLPEIEEKSPILIEPEIHAPLPSPSITPPPPKAKKARTIPSVFSKKLRRGGRLKWPKDSRIELAVEELQIQPEAINDYMIDRPFYRSLPERSLAPGDWEKLMTIPLGNYLGPQQSDYFRSSMEQLLLAPQIRRTIEQEEEEKEEFEEPEIPYQESGLPQHISPIPVPIGPSPVVALDATTPVIEPVIEPIGSKKTSPEIEPVQELFPPSRPPSIPEQVSVHLSGILSSPSEELTGPAEMSRLSREFQNMIAENMRTNKKNYADFETLMKESAMERNVNLTRRDVALGFMQSLILKASNIIELTQEQSYGSIRITPGLEFDTRQEEESL